MQLRCRSYKALPMPTSCGQNCMVTLRRHFALEAAMLHCATQRCSMVGCHVRPAFGQRQRSQASCLPAPWCRCKRPTTCGLCVEDALAPQRDELLGNQCRKRFDQSVIRVMRTRCPHAEREAHNRVGGEPLCARHTRTPRGSHACMPAIPRHAKTATAAATPLATRQVFPPVPLQEGRGRAASIRWLGKARRLRGPRSLSTCRGQGTTRSRFAQSLATLLRQDAA